MFKLFWLILLPVIAGVLIYLFNNKKTKELTLAFQSAFLIYSLYFFNLIYKNGALVEKTGSWDAPIGILLKTDKLNFTFVILTIFLFFISYIFAFKERYFNHIFIFLTLTLQGLLLGLFVSNDLFNIFVLTEISTVLIAILIMFNKENRVIYDGIVFFLLNMVAMTFFLVGIGFVYKIFGTLDLDLIKGLSPMVEKSNLILPYSFLITALVFKCALVPLWSYAIRAYSTPSSPAIVSIILACISSKVSFILLFKVNGIFVDIFSINQFFIIIGALTGIIAFVLALAQTDLRKILAYHSISQMGFIIFATYLVGISSFYGAFYHAINHSLFKSLLFLGIFVIHKHYNSYTISDIKGVFKELPHVAIPLIIGVLSITGAPFFNGSISKYYISKDINTFFINILFQLMLFGTTLSFVKFSSIFSGSKKIVETKSNISFNEYFSLYALAFLCFIGGIFGKKLMSFFFDFKSTFDFSLYMKKSLFYILSVIISIYLYKTLYPKIKIFKSLREKEFDFRILVSNIVLFFIIFVIFLKISI